MFKRVFYNNNFWNSVFTLSGGQIVAQCINLFSVPIVSRIYSKEAYGSFGLLTSTATLMIGFIGFGLGSAIMAPTNEEESKTIFQVGFSLQFALATVICIGMILISPQVRFFDINLPYAFSIIVMYVYTILSVHSSLMYTYINRLMLNKVLLINPLIGALSTVLITLPLGLLGLDTIGLYVANIISLLIINIHMMKAARPFDHFPTWMEFKKIILKYRDFMIYQYPSNLMGTFSGQLPNQLLGRRFGIPLLGDYSMCNKIFGMPSALIASPIQTIYFRTAAQKIRDGEDLAEFTYSLVTKILFVGILPTTFLMAFGKELFAFVLGSKWETAGEMASVLSLQYLFSFCYNCVTYCRVTIGKQKVNMFVTMFQLILIVTSLIGGYTLFGTLTATIFCFSIANLFFNIINLTINFRCLGRYTFRFIRFAFLISLLSVLMAWIMMKLL